MDNSLEASKNRELEMTGTNATFVAKSKPSTFAQSGLFRHDCSLLLRQAMFLHFSPEGGPIDVEGFRGLLKIPLMGGKDFEHGLFLLG
jgi:hypothetical protein